MSASFEIHSHLLLTRFLFIFYYSSKGINFESTRNLGQHTCVFIFSRAVLYTLKIRARPDRYDEAAFWS